MNRRDFLKAGTSAALVTLITPLGISCVRRNSASAFLEESFHTPPASARPFTWWHWMNGNVTKEGITRDLEAMAKVGIGGFQAFMVSSGIPEGAAEYLSPLWIELMQHAAQEAGRLDLEFAMNNCMGWSTSGGSWITPELSMQQVTWSESFVTGGARINLVLPQPSSNSDYYRDTFVLAFPSGNSLQKPARIQDWRIKANYPRTKRPAQASTEDPDKNEEEPTGFIVDPDKVLDISGYMDRQGRLNWDAPAGAWTILRFGHTSTGITNFPAAGKGLGLECDKYSREAVDFHFNYMLDRMLPALEPLAKNGKLGMLMDSYEAGMQNWTKEMPVEFKMRTGYDIVKYLPSLTGRVVGSADVTERFLWDFRKTCAGMMADHYYGRFAELCKEHDIISYTEPYNRGPFEQMPVGAKIDINMGEFWIRTPHFHHSIKLAASIQNMHGRQVVGAESFTALPYYSRWQEYPFSMKAQGDYMFTRGVNRYIFHRYTHQPHPSALPGMTMGPWGFHFERTNTWFYQGAEWIKYITRCQYLLQQGIFSGDVLCYTGQDAPGGDLSMGAYLPDLPDGYDFQFADSEILLKQIKIQDGQIVSRSGMVFRLLVLPPIKTMTVGLIRRLRNLVKQGMIVTGPKPEYTPSLCESESDQELKQTAEELWGPGNTGVVDRSIGLGRVFAGFTLKEVLDKLAIKPDFEFTSCSGDAPVHYIHRKIGDNDLYFIANRRRFAETLVCTFRIDGKEPELWDADTGEIIPVSIYDVSGGRIKVPVQLAPGGSVFVFFRKPLSDNRLLSIAKNGQPIMGTTEFPVAQTGLNGQVKDDFTVSVWVKPETEDLLPSVPGPAPAFQRPLVNYVVYPPAGEELFGQGHAGVGLLVARNGVVVFERDKGIPSAVLIAPLPVTGWTHFALVYEGGIPSLFVNGMLVKTGVKSDKTVHPVTGIRFKDKTWVYYEGDMGAPVIYPSSLSASQVVELVTKGMEEPENQVVIEQMNSKTPALRFWQNGDYTLNKTIGGHSTLNITDISRPVPLSGEWTVTFPPNRGAPEQVVLPQLISLHMHSEDGVKYFSGTATYHKSFGIDPSFAGGNKRIFLDLGRIAVIAEVMLNGTDLGIVWKPPYRIDITDVAKVGVNDLQVKVTNLWPNRLIGDEQLPAENEYGKYGEWGYGKYSEWGAGILKLPDWYLEGKPKPAGGRITFSVWRHFDKDAPLLESGLIGPVVISNAVTHPLSL